MNEMREVVGVSLTGKVGMPHVHLVGREVE